MRGRIDQHAKYRELLAARLDRQLTRPELRGLNAHLKKCTSCEQVDADYRAQRHLLRGLNPPLPPRDLWARTSASLDREVARAYRAQKWNRRLARSRRSAQPSTALMTAVAVVGVTAAIAVLQLAPAFTPVAQGPSQPTPVAVAPQALTFFGVGPNDAALYSTEVSEVCPASAPDCLNSENLVRTPVQLPKSMRSTNAALSPTGKQLAVVGHITGGDVIAVVTMPQDNSGSGGGDTGTSASHTAGPQAQIDAPDATPAPAKTQQTTGIPAAVTPVPAASSAIDVGGAGDTTPPGAAVVSILDNVQSVGAAPAWSPNSGMLAFSAMPADGSTGPDVYIWSPGDDQAQAITSDHQSYFASWSGNRIVLSQVTSNGRVHNSVIDPQTLEERPVVGPGLWLPNVNNDSSEAMGWYGQLDTTGTVVTPETGMLYVMDWSSVDPFGAAAPTDESVGDTGGGNSGGDSTPTIQPTPSANPTPSETPSPTATASPTSTPDASSSPSGSPRSHSSSSPAESADVRTASPTPSATPAATPTPTRTPTPTPTVAPTALPSPTATDATTDISNLLVPVEPDRDPTAAPVLDWQVHWSSDGQVVGVWVADSAGSTWGRLAVMSVDPNTDQVATDSPLLAWTLAKRGFSMGDDRVAWVASSNTDVDGELRIRTWGSDGVGGLRLTAPDDEDVVPAF